MTVRRAAALGVGALLVALLVAWLLGPEPTTRDVEPALREAAVRVIEEGERLEAPEAAAEAERVECALWRTVGDTEELVLDEVDPETLESVGLLFPERLKQAMRFTPRNPVGLGRLHLTNHDPAVISWAAGSCLDFVELEERPMVTVTGRVTGVVETGAVSVAADCDGTFSAFDSPQPPEAPFTMRFPAESTACTLVVRRVFGGRDLTAEYEVAVRDQEGLELAVPAAPGVGLGLSEVEEGLRVYGVEPGSPAARAGVEMMDLVVSIDGEDAADLVADEVVLEEGPVVLEVLRDGQTLELRVGGDL
jgi:hypothetical protein